MRHLVLFLGILLTVIAACIMLSPTKAAAIQLYLTRDQYAPRERSLVIIPVLTGNAYRSGGFYDYYSGRCGVSCLTVQIDPGIPLREESSAGIVNVLSNLGYEFESDYNLDYELDTDPNYLRQYHTVILLHSEYVTQRIFDAVTSHPNVVYLAPNSLYGKVEIHGDMMTLIQGHSYHGMDNGFGWIHDNTHPDEYDKACKDWQFRELPNGHQLSCNPDTTIWNNFGLLKRLADF